MSTPSSSVKPFWEIPESEWATVNVRHQENPKECEYKAYRCSCCQLVLGYHRKIPGGESPPPDFPKFNCKSCGKAYFTQQHLRRHEIRHNEKRFKCSYCSERFLTRAESRSHVIDKHPKDRPFTCSLCRQSYAYASSFFSHLKRQHSCGCETSKEVNAKPDAKRVKS